MSVGCSASCANTRLHYGSVTNLIGSNSARRTQPVDADLSSTVLPDSISGAYGSRCAFVTSSPIDVSRTPTRPAGIGRHASEAIGGGAVADDLRLAVRRYPRATAGRPREAARLDGAAAVQWKDTEVPAVEITGLPPNIDFKFNLMELIHANHA